MKAFILSRKKFVFIFLTFLVSPFLPKVAGKRKNRQYFQHGVASGDPLQDRVIIWTRISNHDTQDSSVSWELSFDQTFEQVVQNGAYSISPKQDYTVKVDVSGLQPGMRYFYRFRYQDEQSIIGSTQTLPESLDGKAFQIAVVSCTNWESGYFNAFRFLAQKDEVDMVLHLGDYIYEYPAGTSYKDSIGRTHDPRHEIVSLDDYRRRYAQYHTDPDLQLLHASKPFCLVWDDHELANDAYMDGAQNHQPEEEGPWELRKQAAIKAYFEWLPVRGSGPEDLQRKITIGREFDLFLLDQRVTGRTKPLPISHPDFYDEHRSILGKDQYDWLENNLKNSKARWKLIANQVPFTGYKPDADKRPAYLDKWLGYPHERTKMIELFKREKIENTVFLTGDHHRSFVLALHDEKEYMQYTKTCNEKPLAWELLTPSITSRNDDHLPAHEVADRVAKLYNKEINPHLLFADTKSHGYYIAQVDAQFFQADYYFTDHLGKTAIERKATSFTMKADDFLMKEISSSFVYDSFQSPVTR